MWHVWIWGSSQFGKLSLAIFTTRLPLARPHAWASTSSLWLWTTAWTADTLQEPKSKGSPTNPSWKTRISRDRQKEILLASKAMGSTYNQWPFLSFKFQRWMSSVTFGNDENQISKGDGFHLQSVTFGAFGHDGNQISKGDGFHLQSVTFSSQVLVLPAISHLWKAVV